MWKLDIGAKQTCNLRINEQAVETVVTLTQTKPAMTTLLSKVTHIYKWAKGRGELGLPKNFSSYVS